MPLSSLWSILVTSTSMLSMFLFRFKEILLSDCISLQFYRCVTLPSLFAVAFLLATTTSATAVVCCCTSASDKWRYSSVAEHRLELAIFNVVKRITVWMSEANTGEVDTGVLFAEGHNRVFLLLSTKVEHNFRHNLQFRRRHHHRQCLLLRPGHAAKIK